MMEETKDGAVADPTASPQGSVKAPDTFKSILGIKRGMTQVYSEDGRLGGTTVVEAGPCMVVGVRTPEKDGYSAVQVTFGQVKASRVNKPEAGHFAKAGVDPGKRLLELRLDDTSALHAQPRRQLAGA